MEKKFFEYTCINGYPLINEVSIPVCPMGEEDPDTFLVYAEDWKFAMKAAHNHKFGGKPLERFYGSYKGEEYHGEIMCAM